MNIWEQALREKINLCCVSQKTAAALWNINTWNIKYLSMLLTRPGIFLHFHQNSVFFACSLTWAVCGITTPWYQIPQLISHLKQHKLLQASCGVFWGSVTETPLHRLKSLTSHTAWAFQRDTFLLISILSAFPVILALLAFLIWDHIGKKEQFPNRVRKINLTQDLFSENKYSQIIEN